MKTTLTQIYVEGKVTPDRAMKIYRVGVELLLHEFLASAQDRNAWPASRPSTLPPEGALVSIE